VYQASSIYIALLSTRIRCAVIYIAFLSKQKAESISLGGKKAERIAPDIELVQEFVSEDVYQALKLDAAAAAAAAGGGGAAAGGGGVLSGVGVACEVMEEGEEGVGEGVEEEDEKKLQAREEEEGVGEGVEEEVEEENEKLKAREEEEEEDSNEYLTYIKFPERILERRTAGVGALIESLRPHTLVA
jgi:hypothetical protein